MYTYIYLYIHVYTCIYMYIHIYILYMCILCVCVYIYIYIYTYMYSHILKQIDRKTKPRCAHSTAPRTRPCKHRTALSRANSGMLSPCCCCCCCCRACGALPCARRRGPNSMARAMRSPTASIFFFPQKQNKTVAFEFDVSPDAFIYVFVCVVWLF